MAARLPTRPDRPWPIWRHRGGQHSRALRACYNSRRHELGLRPRFVPGGDPLKPADTARQGYQRDLGDSHRYTEWQRFFLNRLEALLRLQAQAAGSDEMGSRLIRKAIYSTLGDCTALGVGDEAAAMVKEGVPPASPN